MRLALFVGGLAVCVICGTGCDDTGLPLSDASAAPTGGQVADGGRQSRTDAGAAPRDGGLNTAGVCGGQVAQGQACNSIVDDSTPITPTCDTGEVPTGTGGTIVDGTYVLTAQTYYNQTTCPDRVSIGGTYVISGNCTQIAAAKFGITASASTVVQGNSITTTQTCWSSAVVVKVSQDAATATFTATPDTFTIFHRNSGTSSPNPDRVEVFTRR